MQYAIKITDLKGNWEADSIGYMKRLFHYDKEYFLRINNNIGGTPYFFYELHSDKFGSYQEANCLCRKLKEKMGNSRSFRPISRKKCLYLDNRNYSRTAISNSRIRRFRKKIKSKDPVKETPFETLRRKHREKENR